MAHEIIYIFLEKRFIYKKIKNKIKCIIIVDDNFGFLFKMCLIIIFKSIFFTIWKIKFFKVLKLLSNSFSFVLKCTDIYTLYRLTK